MKFYTIRLIGTDKFIGKRSSSYALKSDQWLSDPHTGRYGLQEDAHWFVEQKFAKVWTRIAPIKALVSMARRSPGETFSLFEVVCSDGSTTSLDDFLT